MCLWRSRSTPIEQSRMKFPLLLNGTRKKISCLLAQHVMNASVDRPVALTDLVFKFSKVFVAEELVVALRDKRCCRRAAQSHSEKCLCSDTGTISCTSWQLKSCAQTRSPERYCLEGREGKKQTDSESDEARITESIRHAQSDVLDSEFDSQQRSRNMPTPDRTSPVHIPPNSDGDRHVSSSEKAYLVHVLAPHTMGGAIEAQDQIPKSSEVMHVIHVLNFFFHNLNRA